MQKKFTWIFSKNKYHEAKFSKKLETKQSSYCNLKNQIKSCFTYLLIIMDRNQTLLINPQKQPSRGVLRKRFLKICSKFTEEHPRRSGIWTKLLCTFIEITLRHGCSPVNLLHFFRTPFPKNVSWGLLLDPSRYMNRKHKQTWNQKSIGTPVSSRHVEKYPQNSQEKTCGGNFYSLQWKY